MMGKETCRWREVPSLALVQESGLGKGARLSGSRPQHSALGSKSFLDLSMSRLSLPLRLSTDEIYIITVGRESR